MCWPERDFPKGFCFITTEQRGAVCSDVMRAGDGTHFCEHAHNPKPWGKTLTHTGTHTRDHNKLRALGSAEPSSHSRNPSAPMTSGRKKKKKKSLESWRFQSSSGDSVLQRNSEAWVSQAKKVGCFVLILAWRAETGMSVMIAEQNSRGATCTTLWACALEDFEHFHLQSWKGVQIPNRIYTWRHIHSHRFIHPDRLIQAK